MEGLHHHVITLAYSADIAKIALANETERRYQPYALLVRAMFLCLSSFKLANKLTVGMA